MGNSRPDSGDAELVSLCLSGNETAWVAFYSRYLPLVREIVRRQRKFLPSEMEDVIQTVFTGLLSALETYDGSYSLSSFVGTVAKRECIDQYRNAKAAKRDAPTDPIDHHDSSDMGALVLESHCKRPDDELVHAELTLKLNQAVLSLGARCRDLLRMRYYDDLPYKKIREIFDVAENTLVVQVRRCLDELRAAWDELARKGIQR